MEPNPNEDGKQHLNVYSKGSTDLGRWLSNFTHSPFIHPEHGRFESMEGFWFWISTGMIHHNLKAVWGYKAKQEGKVYPKKPNPKFKELIKSALKCKISQNKEYKEKFINSKLPFEHYYYYGNVQNHRVKIIVPASGKMLINILEELRAELRGK